MSFDYSLSERFHPGRVPARERAVSGPTNTFHIIQYADVLCKLGEYQYRVLLASGAIVRFTVNKTRLFDFRYDAISAFGFTEVPQGDWNVARLAHGKKDGKLEIISTEFVPDPVERWCEAKMDVGELGDALDPTPSEEILLDRVFSIGVFTAPSGPWPERVLAMWGYWWDSPSLTIKEAKVFGLVQGLGITLPWLSYLTENKGSRVIGWVMEPLEIRLAGPEDAAACRTALKKLHNAGLALGYITRMSFLIRKDGQGAVLRFLHSVYEPHDASVFSQELAKVDEVLGEEAYILRDKLEVVDKAMSEEAWRQRQEITERDGFLHPLLDQEIDMYGIVKTTQKEHRALLRMLARMGSMWRRDEDTQEALRQRQQHENSWVPLVIGEYRTEDED